MLQTNLQHLMTEEDFNKTLQENENVMICCGRMGPMCIPVYEAMEELEEDYENVKFADMEFDNPEAHVIRNHEACRGFNGLPFTVYFKNGELVKATSSIQGMDQITENLDANFK